MTSYDYDFLVIGGGHGGLASAKRAARNGANVAVVEGNQFGGTGLNFGTVPKKIMYHAAYVQNVLKNDAAHYGVNSTAQDFSWDTLKQNRDAYLRRIQQEERKELEQANITILTGMASFVNEHTIQINNSSSSNNNISTVTSANILLSLGSRSVLPEENGIRQHCITSDAYLHMDKLPNKVVVAVQSEGYIGFEISYVLHSLGCETHFVLRGPTSMRYADSEANALVDSEMERLGVSFHRESAITEVSANSSNNKKLVSLKDGSVISDVDTVIYTPIRMPNVEYVQLSKAGIAQREGGYVAVDSHNRTSVPHIFAVGDVTTEVHQLTPKTIAAAETVADRLFLDSNIPPVSFDDTPYAFLAHPSIANVGLTQTEAIEKHGHAAVKVYRSWPKNLYHGIMQSDRKSFMKMICVGPQEKVVGLHMVGMHVEEGLQGFAVAIKMGATKADFDSCLSIEPTLAGSVVNMQGDDEVIISKQHQDLVEEEKKEE